MEPDIIAKEPLMPSSVGVPWYFQASLFFRLKLDTCQYILPIALILPSYCNKEKCKEMPKVRWRWRFFRQFRQFPSYNLSILLKVQLEKVDKTL